MKGLHTTQRLGGVLAWLYVLCPDSNIGWPNVDPKLVLSSRHRANASPTYTSVWLVRFWGGLPIWVTHTTEPTHHRAAGLCAARWCATRLCAIRLGCVEGYACVVWEYSTYHELYIYVTFCHASVSVSSPVSFEVTSLVCGQPHDKINHKQKALAYFKGYTPSAIACCDSRLLIRIRLKFPCRHCTETSGQISPECINSFIRPWESDSHMTIQFKQIILHIVASVTGNALICFSWI